MKIGQLAKAAGVGVETVRYYHRIGLLEEPRKPDSGFRNYTPRSLEQLTFIRRAKGLGFSLNDIRELLAIRERPDACREMCAVTERIVEDVRQRISALQTLESTLVGLLNGCPESSTCLILQALEQDMDLLPS